MSNRWHGTGENANSGLRDLFNRPSIFDHPPLPVFPTFNFERFSIPEIPFPDLTPFINAAARSYSERADQEALQQLMLRSPADPIADAERQLEQSMTAMERARDAVTQAQLRLQEARRPAPTEPDQDGAVIRFDLTFVGNTKVYNFAALRVGGRWFTTGASCPPAGFTWQALVNWLRSAEVQEVRNGIVMGASIEAGTASYWPIQLR